MTERICRRVGELVPVELCVKEEAMKPKDEEVVVSWFLWSYV